MATLVADHVQDGAEHFAFEKAQAFDLIQGRRDVGTGAAEFRHRQIDEFLALTLHTDLVGLEHVLCRLVDDRPDIGAKIHRVSDVERFDCSDQHGLDARRGVVLDKKDARGGATLTGAVIGRTHAIAYHLLGKRG